MALFLSLLLVVFFGDCHTESTGSRTGISGWAPEPGGRGTFDILRTSIVTLLLCVWTAIHPDITLNLSPLEYFVHKLWWMVCGILAPEALISYSLGQLIRARRLHKAWCVHFNVTRGSSEDLLGMQGAFFVVMGGVTCGPRDVEGNYPKPMKPNAFILLTQQGIIPRDFLDARLIGDKCKADDIAKLVVCAQVSWVLVHTIIRKVIGLPLTLLVMHVVIQVLCTIVTYSLWWHKPQGVKEPIPIVDYRQSEHFRICYDIDEPLVISIINEGECGTKPRTEVINEESTERGILLEASFHHNDDSHATIRVPYQPGPQHSSSYSSLENSAIYPEQTSLNHSEYFLRLSIRDGGTYLPIKHCFTAITFLPISNIPTQRLDLNVIPAEDIILVFPGETLVGKDFFISRLYESDADGPVDRHYRGYHDLRNTNCKPINSSILGRLQKSTHRLRLQRFENLNQKDNIVNFLKWTFTSRDCPNHLTKKLSLLRLMDKIRGDVFDERDVNLLVIYAIFALCGTAHLVAWNNYFPTKVEQLLWRISCFHVLILICAKCLVDSVPYLLGKNFTIAHYFGNLFWTTVSTVILGLGGSFLAVESFVSLRDVPQEVYQTIPLARYWPHF